MVRGPLFSSHLMEQTLTKCVVANDYRTICEDEPADVLAKKHKTALEADSKGRVGWTSERAQQEIVSLGEQTNVINKQIAEIDQQMAALTQKYDDLSKASSALFQRKVLEAFPFSFSVSSVSSPDVRCGDERVREHQPCQRGYFH